MKRFLPFLKIAAVMFIAAAALSCNRQDEAQKYTITITDDGRGTAVANHATAAAGTPVTITAIPDANYVFDRWAVVSGGVILSDATANPAIFTMPVEDVEIRAEFVLFNGFDLMTDPTFKTACEQFDTNSDGILSQQEAGVVTEINVYNNSSESLAGIEIFTNLTHLNCYGNYLSALDLSNNKALTHLNCFNNSISALDVSNLEALTVLNCFNNNLSALDVSNNAVLEYLDCTSNNLSAEAIRNMFGSLPDLRDTTQGIVGAVNNPGWGDITAEDIKVAEDKNWWVANN